MKKHTAAGYFVAMPAGRHSSACEEKSKLRGADRIADEPRRRQSYTFLDRETNRLHRLVEDLLDFGRMESGRKQYRLEAHDAFQLVRSAVTDFSQEAAAGGFQVETTLGSGPATIRADEEAFRRAVRNLLENAMKYSPECRTVWVEGAVDDHRVSISVRDRGMGIDPREQREIFQKFVRGSAAKKAGSKAPASDSPWCIRSSRPWVVRSAFRAKPAPAAPSPLCCPSSRDEKSDLPRA